MSKTRILIVVNADWYFWSHRLPLAKALKAEGCQVSVAAAVERGYQQRIETEGFRFLPLRLQRHSMSIFRELETIRMLYCLYRQEHPDLIHHITIKPVIYGSLAAKLAGIQAVINTIPGLGYMFVGTGIRATLRQQLVLTAYRLALNTRKCRVIFQNPDDYALFIDRGIVTPERSVLIRGSGVDIQLFLPSPDPPGIPLVLMASRLLMDKGVGDLVEASRILKKKGVECRVALVGAPDLENPNSVTSSQLEDWQSEGVVEWWGLQDNMPAVLKAAGVVVLPSYYREGVPKILLEAAASGKPIITTDIPGCREIVRHGENGFLVPPKSPSALAEAIATLIRDKQLREKMGAKGRMIVETEFSEEQVLKETLQVYRHLLGERWPGEQN